MNKMGQSTQTLFSCFGFNDGLVSKFGLYFRKFYYFQQKIYVINPCFKMNKELLVIFKPSARLFKVKIFV